MTALEQIVVGFDGSDRGRDALRLGELLARTVGARLRVARVYGAPASGSEEQAEDRSEELSGELDRFLAGDVAAEPLPLPGHSAARALQELAEAEPVGALVLGSTHRAGLGRVVPGSVADRLLSGAPCPVAIAPRGYEADGLRVIGVGFDGSREAERALELAATIGVAAEATLRVIAVQGAAVASATAVVGGARGAPGPSPPDLQSRLHDVVSRLPSELRALPVFEKGDPVGALVERAQEGVDLMALGSRGYGPLRAVLLGSVSAGVLRDAPCPVLITPRAAG